MRKRGLLWVLVGLLFVVSCSRNEPFGNKYFPDSGEEGIQQASKDLSFPVHVLFFVLEPGQEDLATMAYFRLQRGARVRVAYLSNGEQGESDVQVEYPPYVAFRRRIEAEKVARFLGGDVYFLNLPHVIAARNEDELKKVWEPDSLDRALAQMLNNVQPDIILFAHDWPFREETVRWKYVLGRLESLIRRTGEVDTLWRPRYLLVEKSAPGADTFQFPVHKKHQASGKTFEEIGREAGRFYYSLERQRLAWKNRARHYRQIWSAYSIGVSKFMEQASDLMVPGEISGLYLEVEKWVKGRVEGNKTEKLRYVADLLDTLNFALFQKHRYSDVSVRIMFDWKEALEKIQYRMQNVKVNYTLSDTLLTEHQLTYFRVDGVEADHLSDNLEIFFAGFEREWAINESIYRKFPLKEGKEFRLLSPGQVAYTYPPGQTPFQLHTVAKRYYAFLIQRAEKREHNFVFRIPIELSFAPRFITEVLTPIVYATPGEGVAVRLINVSRDGVADTVEIRSAYARSDGKFFRLSQKDSFFQDTLYVKWWKLKNGDHLIPVSIGGIPVAQVGVRKFPVKVDSTRRVAVFSPFQNSPVVTFLKRFRFPYRFVRNLPELRTALSDIDVLVIDHRALSFHPELAEFGGGLEEFVTGGGVLLVLSQDFHVWNEKPLWPGMELEPDSRLSPSTLLAGQFSDWIFHTPNELQQEDWAGWIHRLGYHRIRGPAVEQSEVLLKTHEGVPLLLRWREGKGVKYYINLCLYPQLLNVHQGAFKLLANLISSGQVIL